jgi:hypothetical protein
LTDSTVASSMMATSFAWKPRTSRRMSTASSRAVTCLPTRLIAAVALDPPLVQTRTATVDVELAGTLTRGMTIADWSGRWGRPPNAHVGVEVDPGAFFDRFIERVGRTWSNESSSHASRVFNDRTVPKPTTAAHAKTAAVVGFPPSQISVLPSCT